MYSFLRLHTAKNISIHLCNNSSAYTLLKKFYPSMYSFLRLHTAKNTAPVYMYSYIYIHLHMYSLYSLYSYISISTLHCWKIYVT